MNEYSHPEAWGKYWHQYYNGSIGTSAIVGDVDGDDLPDVFLVNKDSPNALYLNTGDFRFEEVTDQAGVAGKTGFGSGASFVDVDNDGDLDLYVGYVGSENELFINDGNGVFSEEGEAWGLNINTGTNAPSFADMDRDGDLDLYLQCNFLEAAEKPEGMPDLLFENRGDYFVEITAEAGIKGRGQGHAAIWWDYNEDGWPDIYVANDFAPTDKLYLNNKDNTFKDVIKETLVAAPYFGMGADLGDINNDGHVDFMVADMASPDHVKHHVSVGTQGSYLLDISKSKVSQYMYNMVSLKIGPNQFAEVGHLTGLEATGWTWAVRLVDMDNDGWLDAYFTNGMIREFHNSDLAMRMGRARSVMHRIKGYENSPALNEANLVFRNEGGLSFRDLSKEWGLDDVGISFAASYADLDQDGDLDLLINNLNTPPTLYENTSVDGRRVILRLEGVESNRFGYGAKVTARVGETVQVRELSSTRGYMSQDEPVVHFAFAEAEAIDELRIEWPSGKVQRLESVQLGKRYRIREEDTVGSKVREETETLFVRSEIEVSDDTESEEEFYDPFSRQPLLPFDETWSGPLVRVGDLDGDGWSDVVMGGATGLETRVFRNEEGEALELVESDVFFDDYDSEDSGLALFDFDGDADLDLLALAGSMELDGGSEFYQDRIYLNVGDLEFERLDGKSFDAPATASRGRALIDLDADGDFDVVIGGATKKDQYPFTEDNQVWVRDGERFVRNVESSFAVAFGKSGKVMELLAVDLDADGRTDLLQATEWGEAVFWRMTDSGLVRDGGGFSAEAGSGLWRSVEVGDFNGDGLRDVFLGNVGGNSRYRPSVDAPVALFSQIRDGVGAHLQARTVDGKLLLTETRNIASKQFSREISATTRTYEEYATTPVEVVFPDLGTAFRRDEITESRTVILLQEKSGGFRKVALPALAQTGMAIDAVVLDCDGDGLDDLVLSLEPVPPNSWAGRRLKGHLVVIEGSGDERFEALMPWRSGLEVNGYPKHLATADLDRDGKSEVLVGLNEGPLLVFELN
ncbi:VCBS repeat-containing protein [Pelagicoccus mobilis]|uniref:VCBS repeat-containing protein n=1 Tax=Pelagicoccus mobilis TaxID=415221 RepID=A0A934S637_9BACT|nr:VCBS repeat-containing protein [Pelagicoccus mobilis]